MKKLYLLGAGFSKSVLGDIMPVTNELFDKLDIKQIKDLSDL